MVEADITSLSALRAAEAACTRCPLYRNATQVVPGEGPARARLMMVGEQPGDQEDLQGRPFVGPAGRVLDRAIADAGIDRSVTIARGSGALLTGRAGERLLVTIHPSYLLQLREEDDKARQYAQFAADLRIGAKYLQAAA